MLYRLCADVLVVIHLSFVVFAIFGGIMLIRWRRAVWLHIPAVVVAVLAEFAGWICPLTYIENWLRIKGGQAGYSGGFVEHYIVPILYPPGLTRGIQVALGLFILTLNAIVYWLVFARRPKEVRDGQ